MVGSHSMNTVPGRKMRHLFSRIPTWFLILIASFIVFQETPDRITTDLSMYTNAGLNLLLGYGYVDKSWLPQLLRPPLFPGMITVAFWLGEVSYEAVYWVIRVFCILTPVLVYLIGRRFFNRAIGTAAAFLCLSSYSIIVMSIRNLDSTWPFFVMLSILLIDFAVEKKSKRLFALAGLIMGASFLVKQSALVFFLYPGLLWLFEKDSRNREVFVGGVIYAIAILVCVVPWCYWAWSVSGNLLQGLLSRDGAVLTRQFVETNSQTLLSIVFSKIGGFLKGIAYYYGRGTGPSVIDGFMLAPLFAVSWLYFLGRSFTIGKGYLRWSIAFVLMLPYMSHTGNNALRAAQLIVLFTLSYIPVSVMMYDLVQALKIKSRFVWLSDSKRFFKVLIVVLIGVQFFGGFGRDKGTLLFLADNLLSSITIYSPGDGTEWYGTSKGYYKLVPQKAESGETEVDKKKPEESLRDTGIVSRPMALPTIRDYLMEHTAPKEAICVGFMASARNLYFLLNGRNPVIEFPSARLTSEASVFMGQVLPDESPLYLGARGRFASSPLHLLVMYESLILDLLKVNDIRYVVLTPWLGELVPYFDRNKGFNRVLTLQERTDQNKKYIIYEVDSYDSVPDFSKPIHGKGLAGAMKLTNSVDVSAYDNYKKILEASGGDRKDLLYGDEER
nr:glycosyltransferase family 39 protein [uncultured Pseudodesulfovibrio sp.]